VRQIAAIALAGCAAVLAGGCGSSSSHADRSGAGTPGAGGTGTLAASANTTAGSGSDCVSQQQPGIDASFGVRRSPTAAQRLIARAGRVGFQNLTVQRRSCNRYAAVLVGLSSMAQAHEFEKEAAGAGFQVLLECRSQPVRGGLAAVFGHRRSHRAAVVLMRAASAKGFQNLQVLQDRCGDWEVDLYGAETAKQRAGLRREAAVAGYRLTFEPG
jgi:hypothetical protein